MKISAIIQARTKSTRLPGKVFKELPENSGVTCLEHVIRRLKRCRKLDEIIVATTMGAEDWKIVDIAKKENVKYFQGCEKNVLKRFYLAALATHVDIIVRVTSDCPCIDPKIVDRVIESHLKLRKTYIDFTANNIIPTYPHGLDVEVFDFDILERAYIEAKTDFDREHVTPFIRNHPKRFRINNISAPAKLNIPDIRITLDTEEDYTLLKAIFARLYPFKQNFDIYDIIKLYEKNDWLHLINDKSMKKYTLGREGELK